MKFTDSGEVAVIVDTDNTKKPILKPKSSAHYGSGDKDKDRDSPRNSRRSQQNDSGVKSRGFFGVSEES